MNKRKQTWKAAVSAAATPRRGSLLYKTPTIRAVLAAITIAASAVLPSFAATTITESVTLTEDTDWTEFGTVTLAPGVTVDLNGHKLYTSGIVGSAGSIGTTDYVKNGSFENGYSFTANSGKWAYARNITFNNFGWTGDSGISKESGTWKQVAAPGGSAVWFFQGAKQVSTTVNVPESGFYTVTFYYGARANGNKGGEIHVDVGAIQDYGKVTCSAYNSKTTQATV